MRQLEGMGDEINLLHMNCEGCEWEMLENLLKQPDVISKVPKIGTHFYKHRGAFFGKFYCTFTGEMFTSWHPLFSRGEALKTAS